MEYVIDSELLILAIEKRPLLWNNQHEFYKDRNRKRDAWIEVCEIFFDDLDTKEEVEKVFISKQVELKWRHIRDNYTRDLRAKAKSTAPRGKTKRKYIYANQLEFLRRHIEHKFKMEEEDSQGTEHDASNDGNEAEEPAENEDSDEPVELIPRKKSAVKAHRINIPITSTSRSAKALPFEESLIPMEAAGGGAVPQREAPPPTEESDDMSFFRSLTPMLTSLSAQQKMRFRIDVMQQLMKYHNEQQQHSSNMKFDYNV